MFRQMFRQMFPGKTLAPQGFWGKWNIGTFIFYIRVKERI